MTCTVSDADQPPALSEIRTGPDLRAWRFGVTGLGVRSGGQQILAELLGISPRRLREWESGEHRFPQLLPSALHGIEHDLRIAGNRERRRRAANRRSTWRRRSRRRRTAYFAKRRLEERAELRAIRERGTQLESLQSIQRRRMHATLNGAARFVSHLERTGQIRCVDGTLQSFIKPPRMSVVRPRKIRSDFGKHHRFRGRPGFPLRPEDIQFEG